MDGVSEDCREEETHRERRTAMQSKTSTTSGSVNDFHFQAEFSFLLEQVWLDTEEGTA